VPAYPRAPILPAQMQVVTSLALAVALLSFFGLNRCEAQATECTYAAPRGDLNVQWLTGQWDCSLPGRVISESASDSYFRFPALNRCPCSFLIGALDPPIQGTYRLASWQSVWGRVDLCLPIVFSSRVAVTTRLSPTSFCSARLRQPDLHSAAESVPVVRGSIHVPAFRQQRSFAARHRRGER
jgi:hypothetical protein